MTTPTSGTKTFKTLNVKDSCGRRNRKLLKSNLFNFLTNQIFSRPWCVSNSRDKIIWMMFDFGKNIFKILVVAVWFSNADSKGKNNLYVLLFPQCYSSFSDGSPVLLAIQHGLKMYTTNPLLKPSAWKHCLLRKGKYQWMADLLFDWFGFNQISKYFTNWA